MKKGQAIGLMSLATVVIIFLLAGMAAIYSLDILDETREDFCDYNYDAATETCYQCSATFPSWNTTALQCYNSSSDHSAATVNQDTSFNATSSSIDGVNKVPDKMGTLANVVIAGIIIGVLLAAFGGFVAMQQQ